MRKNGVTTRIIDEAIQALFTVGSYEFRDHHGTTMATKFALETLMKRLLFEHQMKNKINYLVRELKTRSRIPQLYYEIRLKQN